MRVARLWLVVGMAVASGCGGGGDDPPTGTSVFTTLEVTPATVSVAVTGTQTLTVRALNQSNQTMSGLSVTYESSDETKATVNSSGVVTGVAVGTAQITVTGTVGTATKTRDIAVTVSAPGLAASVNATAQNQFNPETVVIAPGGQVTWQFAAQHNVTFSAANAPEDIGNRSSGSEARTFPSAGTFDYICTIHGSGMNGTVRVQ